MHVSNDSFTGLRVKIADWLYYFHESSSSLLENNKKYANLAKKMSPDNSRPYSVNKLKTQFYVHGLTILKVSIF